MENSEEPKSTREELVKKARKVKAEKAKARKEAKADVLPPTIEIKELDINKKEVAPLVVEEVVRVPANRKKKIVKRTIEIEESETDEEIIEEIVKIPKMRKEVKISRDEMKKKLIENNRQRLHNELFS